MNYYEKIRATSSTVKEHLENIIKAAQYLNELDAGDVYRDSDMSTVFQDQINNRLEDIDTDIESVVNDLNDILVLLNKSLDILRNGE